MSSAINAAHLVGVLEQERMLTHQRPLTRPRVILASGQAVQCLCDAETTQAWPDHQLPKPSLALGAGQKPRLVTFPMSLTSLPPRLLGASGYAFLHGSGLARPWGSSVPLW